MRKSIFPMALTVAAALGSAFAAEGRIPVHGPTTLSQPGTYVLTRNVSVSSGDVIVIDASHVVLDLNGKTISSTATTGYLIVIADSANNNTAITVRNGALSGGQTGVYFSSTTRRTRVSAENISIENTSGAAIHVYGAEYAEVVDCSITNAGGEGVYLHGYSASFGGRIARNKIIGTQTHGMYLYGLRGGGVSENHVFNYGKGGNNYGVIASGDVGWAAGANVIENNTLRSTTTGDTGIYVDAYSYRNLLQNNTAVNNQHGIFIYSTGNRLVGNVCGVNALDGIWVQGSRNVIERNMCEANSRHGIHVSGNTNLADGNTSQGNSQYGLYFANAGNINAFRDNMLRGNGTGGVFQNGATDAGGNIIP